MSSKWSFVAETGFVDEAYADDTIDGWLEWQFGNFWVRTKGPLPI